MDHQFHSMLGYLHDKTILITGATGFLGMGKELFKILRETWGADFDSFVSQKVIALPGDVSSDENLGVKDMILLENICNEIQIIVSSAANTNFDESFDDTNTEELRKITKECYIEAEDFNFDPTCIDWEDYMMNTHIPGFLKHVLSK